MKFYIDEQNSKGDYCYHTFESSLSGEPLLILKKHLYLVIPTINLGIYDLKSFKDGLGEITFIDKSYYIFSKIFFYEESTSLRDERGLFGNLKTIYESKNALPQSYSNDLYKIEMETGITKNYCYGAVWNVRCESFGIMIPENSLESMNEKDFKIFSYNVSDIDLCFLTNQNQNELNESIEKLD
jgi:hypothetical protein